MSAIRHLPNILTVFRIVLIPAFVVLLVNPADHHVRYAMWVFIIAAVTDYFDGMIARKYNAVSDFGKLLDPAADKILVMAALVMLTGLRSNEYGEPWVQAWMVVMVLARETWVTGLRALAASEGTVVPADSLGKWKSMLQCVAVVLLLLHTQELFTLGQMRITGRRAGEVTLLLSLVLSYTGAVDYTRAILGRHLELQAPD